MAEKLILFVLGGVAAICFVLVLYGILLVALATHLL